MEKFDIIICKQIKYIFIIIPVFYYKALLIINELSYIEKMNLGSIPTL